MNTLRAFLEPVLAAGFIFCAIAGAIISGIKRGSR